MYIYNISWYSQTQDLSSALWASGESTVHWSQSIQCLRHRQWRPGPSSGFFSKVTRDFLAIQDWFSRENWNRKPSIFPWRSWGFPANFPLNQSIDLAIWWNLMDIWHQIWLIWLENDHWYSYINDSMAIPSDIITMIWLGNIQLSGMTMGSQWNDMGWYLMDVNEWSVWGCV